MADLKITVDYKELTSLIKTTDQTKQTIRSLGQAFARTNDSSGYMAGINRVVEAQKRLSVENRLTRSEIMQLGQKYRQQTQFADELAKAQERLGGAVAGSTRKMGRGQVMTQQFGYQMGDFIVQVQSGTNAFVAFGQQATQVAGTLTLVRGSFMGISFLALGAALSILIPLVTAAAAAFMRTRGEGKKFKDLLDELSQAVSDYSNAAEEASRSTTDLRSDFGSLSEDITPLLQDLQELAEIDALSRLESAFSSLDAGASGFRDTVFEALNGGTQAAARFSEQLGLTGQEYSILVGSLTDLENAEGLEAQVRVAQEIRSWIRASVGETEDMTDRMREFYRQLLEITVEGGRLYGEIESATGATDALSRSAMGVYLEFQMVRQGIEDSYTEAEALEDALAAINNGSTEEMQAQIRALARELGIAEVAARAMLNALPITTGMGLRSEVGGVNVVENLLPDADTLAGANTIYQDNLSTSSSGGGGGGGRSAFQSRVTGLQSLQSAITAAAEEARLFEEEIQLLDQALEFGLVTQGQYNQMLEEAHSAYNQAIEGTYSYMQALESANETAKSSTEDALMSIVDGSSSAADAFRNMTQEILSEVYRLLVVRPLMESLFGNSSSGGGLLGGILGGLVPNANGNAFNRGSVVPFATGGIVSGPTNFPMTGGRTGLMGEAGPEAIMPLKRGKGGKLGIEGGSGIVVNQTYNFQGGVTREDLGRALPQLVEASKQSIMETVQRGGSQAEVFR